MKCIRCGTDNNLKDRTANQGRCKNCSHPFVFEPTTMGAIKITDPMFAKAIEKISVNNTLFFTPKQLFYFLDNRLKRKFFNLFGLVFLYLFFSFWTTGFIGGILSTFFGENAFIFVLIIFNLGFIILLFHQTTSRKLENKTRKTAARGLQLLGVTILAVGIFSSTLLLNSFTLFTISVILGMLSIYLGFRQLNKTGLEQDFLFDNSQFQEWLNRWQQINGSINNILPAPREQTLPANINPDITAYSFDRLVVCDSANLAQILIANNFHFENNCAILSITGYPQSIFATTMEMLRRNPNLEVYAFHDCSPRGVSLINNLGTSSQWFADSNITIIDVGLTPRQIIATKRGMFIQTSTDSAQIARQLSPEIKESLSAEELQWLESGKFVELESFTPQRLIQVLNKGIAGVRIGDNSSLFVEDNTSSGSYYIESFG
ncbi:MAG: hypothetical protein QNJ47_10795 [Nostocaceae cyanobacterium]|nr:hypothetical protein [Nostocaceae cyanobacterium]